METRTNTVMIPKIETVYIAKDGREFTNEYQCNKYEAILERIEKGELTDAMKIEELDEQIPINCTDMNENNTFSWYRVNTVEDFITLNTAYHDTLSAPKTYPEVICVETIGETYQDDAYDYHLTDMINVTKGFWNKLGYDVEIKELA